MKPGTGNELNAADNGSNAALTMLMEREEVLQVCYWFQGEGFGDRFTPDAVLPFLQSERERIAEVFSSLTLAGDMIYENGAYTFSDTGRRKGGKMFFETFTEFQQASHGECSAGCCEDGEVCEHHAHGHGHGHDHGNGLSHTHSDGDGDH